MFTFVLAALAVAAVPARANAAVRTGSVRDPQGDAAALSGPALDLESIAVRYDDVAGTLRITWTYYGDVRTGGRGNASITDAPAGNQPYDAAHVQWNEDISQGWSVATTLQLAGVNGSLSGTGSTSADGRAVTAEFTNTALVGHDWRRGTIGTASGDSWDQFWFDGFSDPVAPVSPPPTGPPAAGGGSDAVIGMTINAGALYTNTPDVRLAIIPPGAARTLRVSNDGGFLAAQAFPVARTIDWHLSETGPERLPKTVYLRFADSSQTFTDDIILDQTDPSVSSATLEGAAAQAATTRTYRVRIRAGDKTSGVSKVQFAAAGKKRPGALQPFARVSRFRGTRAPGYVRVRDRAGNYSRWRAVR